MEIWKDIIGYESLYQVSNLGKVKSLKFGKEKILKSWRHRNGYLFFGLQKKGIRNVLLAHRLVCTSFMEKSEGREYVNHKNGIKSDNRVENLEWCTRSENQKHKYRVLGYKGFKPNLGKLGKNNHLSKNINQYSKTGEFIKSWGATMDIERELGICHSGISKCCRGKNKTTGGFIFKYA